MFTQVAILSVNAGYVLVLLSKVNSFELTALQVSLAVFKLCLEQCRHSNHFEEDQFLEQGRHLGSSIFHAD